LLRRPYSPSCLEDVSLLKKSVEGPIDGLKSGSEASKMVPLRLKEAQKRVPQSFSTGSCVLGSSSANLVPWRTYIPLRQE